MKIAQTSRNAGRSWRAAVASRLRASCFHSAIRLSTIVSAAAPWTILTSLVGEKSASSRPITIALTIVPISSMT